LEVQVIGLLFSKSDIGHSPPTPRTRVYKIAPLKSGQKFAKIVGYSAADCLILLKFGMEF